MSNKGHIIIYGGNGSIGKACVEHFKYHRWWVCCIELSRISNTKPFSCNSPRHTNNHILVTKEDIEYEYDNVNQEADVNLLIQPTLGLIEQEHDVINTLATVLKGIQLDAIICVAGGFVKGNATEDLSLRTDLMWKQNVWPSVISARIAISYLKPRGFLCLSGAKTALSDTPNMMAYGLTKAAVNQLTKSLATEGSGLPPECLCLGLLPVKLDSIMGENKKTASSGWTPTEYIIQLLYKWTIGIDRPTSGSLVNFVTKDCKTKVTFV